MHLCHSLRTDFLEDYSQNWDQATTTLLFLLISDGLGPSTPDHLQYV